MSLLADPRPAEPPRADSRLANSRLGDPRFQTAAIGGLLAVAVVVVEILYRLPPFPSDHMTYFQFAEDFPNDPTGGPPHQLTRYGQVLSMRVAQEIFGYSQAAYLVVPILAGAALAVGVYVLGVLLLNRTVGVAAAVLTVGNSMVFPELTQPLPDLFAAAIFCWAVVIALAVRQRRHLLTATRRRETLALVAVGLLLGWSYLTREFIVFAWPLIPVLLYRRVPLPRWLWIALPLAAAGGFELLVNGLIFDNPLARIQASASHGQGPMPTEGPGTYHLGRSREWYLTRLPALLRAEPEGAWLMGALVATMAGALAWRRVRVPALWGLLFAIPLIALGGGMDPDQPMFQIIKIRYWMPFMPAIMLGAVMTTWLAVRAVTSRVPALRAHAVTVASVAAVALAMVPVGIAQYARTNERLETWNTAYAIQGDTQLEQFRSWLAERDGEVETLWADTRSARILRVFVNGAFGGEIWRGQVEVWHAPWETDDGVEQEELTPGDHVFLYSPRSDLCVYCRKRAEALLESEPATAPPSWRLAFTTDDEVVQVYEVR